MSSDVPFQDARTLLTAANLIDGSLIEWPNEPFQEPSSDPARMWLSVECVGRVLDPIEVGGEVWQEEGTLYVHVLAPAGAGSDAARTLAKNVCNVFRGLPARNVVYRGASIGHGVPTDRQGAWWMLTVAIDWIYQDITS